MATVSTTDSDGVRLIEIDNPPVNATSRAVRAALLEAIVAADADPAVKAVVIAAAGRTFVAGGDIAEFGKPPMEPHLPDVYARIEAMTKPVVVAWHGTALGGGCELGLAAHARVISADAKLGLPEVKLGLVPGAGGTQRLPRLVGAPAAAEIIASGRMVGAVEAKALGLVDEIADGDLRAAALARARALAGAARRRTAERQVPAFDAAALDAAVATVLRRARGQAAPGEAVRLVRLASEAPLAEGLAEERRTFLRLMAGEQSAALRHVFFAEREVSKRPDLPSGAARTVDAVGVIGAGTMGAGIAVALLDAGCSVTVVETSEEALARGRDRIAGLFERGVKSGRIDAATAAGRLGRCRFAVDSSALAATDLVVEAVFEDMAVKQELLRRLEPSLRPETIIATNTSYLDVDAMGDVLARPERFVGLHFFSPANVMKLLEIVRAAKTDADTLATALAVGKRLGKIAVVAGVCDGFIGNRILARYREECEFMLEEGALPAEVDAAFEGYGFAMGPFAVSDLAGLDISWARRKRLAATRPADARYVPIADRLCELGRFGQKSGAGWHAYVDGRREVDPLVEEMVRRHAAATGRAQRRFSADDIMARVLDAMGAEGERILAEGVAARPLDIDLVLIHGYGFPPHKGGPMFQRGRRALISRDKNQSVDTSARNGVRSARDGG
jgi:3-hydroxyacyl-CoA dehydrogenase